MSKTRECPSCALEAPADAATCPYCGYEHPAAGRGNRFFALLFILLLLGGVLVGVLQWL